MSKKSFRKNYHLALSHINKILVKYEKVPIVAELSEDQISFIESQIMKIRECLERHKNKLPILEKIIPIRNELAHQKEINIIRTQEIFSRAFPILQQLKQEIESLIYQTSAITKEKRIFEQFSNNIIGTEFQKKQIVDAMESLFETHAKEDIIDFPNNAFSNTIKSIASKITEDNFDYLQTHLSLSENIQTELLNSSAEFTENLFAEDPFFEEETYISQLKNISANELSMSNKKIKNEYLKLYTKDTNIDFQFYQSNFDKLNLQILKKIQSEVHIFQKQKVTTSLLELKKQQEIYARNFINDLEKSLQLRKDEWYLKKIDEWRKQFLDVLYSKIDNFKKLEALLLPFCNQTGYLWDLSSAPFKDVGFDVLQKYSDILEKDESIQELARILGKQEKETEEYEKELRAKVKVDMQFHAVPAYKGEICGLTLSNEISSVLPSELALYKNPMTKKLFELKFAQKQLLSFDYIQKKSRQINNFANQEVAVKKEDEQGPIILCVDTSGSMNGIPEQIAKTLTFAISKIARAENRNCFIISFSTQIKTLDLSGNFFSSLDNLVSFLRMSFNGGTDTIPALKKSLEMLKTENYKNADVLMISDFISSNLDSKTTNEIQEAKNCNTKFYSLVIGNSENRGLIECFNENWFYNLAAKDSMKKVLRDLSNIS